MVIETVVHDRQEKHEKGKPASAINGMYCLLPVHTCKIYRKWRTTFIMRTLELIACNLMIVQKAKS